MRYLACLLLTMTVVSAAEATVLRVGIYQNEPKLFVDDNGVPRGILIDLLEEMARIEEWTLEYVPCDWADCLEALREGRIDLLPDVARTAAREEWFSFHDQPALYSWFQVYRRPGSLIESIIELDGKTIAVLRGSIQESAIKELMEGFGLNATLIPTTSFDEAFRLVSEGIADVTIANHYFGNYHFDHYRLVKTPIVFHPSKLFYATRKGEHLPLLEAIDKHLDAWKESPGSPYYESHAAWLGEAPRLFIPRNVWWAMGLLALVALLATILSFILRREVARRTKELADQNEHLSSVLAELTVTRRKATERESLHILGQMASGIAHDFNNCLTLVLGHAELLRGVLEKDGQLSPDVADNIEMIEQAGLDGSAIVNRLRDFYKSQQTDESEIELELHQMADDLVHMTRPLWKTQSSAAGAPIRVERHLAHVPPILASPRSLRQALLNVVLNAVEAMPEGGTLTLRTNWDGHTVSLEVSDTGIGMTPEERNNCLRPFYTTKAKNGTGMGLSMVESVVVAHRGGISIRSQQGTTITLSFPPGPSYRNDG